MSRPWPCPDFLAASTPRRPAIAWLWCAAALVAVFVALQDWRSARRGLDAQEARLSRALLHAPAAGTHPPMAPTATVIAGPADAQGARAAQAIVARIAHPWDLVLANVETETPDGLQWLALEHDADDGAVHLEGAAVDVATILHFVDSLGDHAGWTDVALARLRASEGREAATGAPEWHFELAASVGTLAQITPRVRGAP